MNFLRIVLLMCVIPCMMDKKQLNKIARIINLNIYNPIAFKDKIRVNQLSIITGIFNVNNEPVNSPEKLMDSLSQYPSNSIQSWGNKFIFFGCHAQWITPESIDEQLPFYDAQRRLAITADAIIDNRAELFEKLQIHPSKQKEVPDSQLILYAYEKWGEDSPKYLIGDFAFIIWDEKCNKLFGARDFSGARTLYYYFDQRQFVFCTLINPLFKIPNIKRRINETWIADFLAIPGMIDSIDVHSTAYKNIMQIPPSHSISLYNGNLVLTRYNYLPDKGKIRLKTNEEYEEALKMVFKEAISSRLRTFRNVGAYLSGGLDSGSVVGFASPMLKEEKKTLYTYSSVPVDGFTDWTSKKRMANETPYIKETINYIGNIKDSYLTFEGDNPYLSIENTLNLMEIPYKFFVNNFWLNGIFETAIHDQVGILLSGERGNATVSWGNALNFQATLLKRLRVIRFLQELHGLSVRKGVKKSRIIAAVSRKTLRLKQREGPVLDALVSDVLVDRTKVLERMKVFFDQTSGDFRRDQFEHLQAWNTNGTFTTKLSTKYSIWNRDPTNDLRVVRFCLAIPDEQYVQNGLDRALIRRATNGVLPDKVRLNEKVRGIQGADGVYRMFKYWGTFINDLNSISKDPALENFLNISMFKKAIQTIKEQPREEYIFSEEFKWCIRGLIVGRFINTF